MSSPRLETARLVLRRFEDADRAAFYALNADPEVRAYFPGVMSRADSDAFVDRINHSIDTLGFGFFCAEWRATGECIGMVGLARPIFDANFTPCIEVGWRLARHFWGMGLATEGAREALRFGFEDLAAEQIFSFTVPANQRSWRVMERLGMQRLGEFDHPALPEGDRLRRHVLYRLRRSEWQAIGR